jgi:hypothetical protein
MLKIDCPKFMHNFVHIFVGLVMNDPRRFFSRKNGEVKVYIFNSNTSEVVKCFKLNTGNM